MSSAHRGLDIRIFRKECVSLAAAGYDTHLVINATPQDVAEASAHDVTVHPMIYVPESRRFSRMSVHAWRCYTTARKLDADLYHFHDPELIPYGLLLAGAGKRVIYDAHENLPAQIYSKDWVPARTRPVVAGLAQRLEEHSAARFSAVVAATPVIGGLFKGVAKRVAVINNYPLMGELAPQGDAQAMQRDSVCYVGGIDGIRGIREAVKAIGKTQSQLLLAGVFSSEALRNEVMQYEGWSKVKEFGFVDRKGVCDILARSFAGLVALHRVPNFFNSQPIKMFEYMSAGVPVIASSFPLWRDVIEGNECGVCVDQNDPDAIAAAIRHFHDRPDEVIRMGDNGRRAVAEKYRWDQEEVRLVSLYQDLLGT
jgi:glycosyltransferase involved in cell wall biosynthesis